MPYVNIRIAGSLNREQKAEMAYGSLFIYRFGARATGRLGLKE